MRTSDAIVDEASFFHQELRPQGIHERVSSWWKFPADLRPTHSPKDDASNFVEVFCIEEDFTILNSLPTIHAGRPKFNPVFKLGEVRHSISPVVTFQLTFTIMQWILYPLPAFLAGDRTPHVMIECLYSLAGFADDDE